MKTKILYLIAIAGLLLAACQDGNNVTNNPPPDPDNQVPGSFSVTADITGLDPVLTWTAAADPDGDPVTYSVLLEGEEVQIGLSDTTATLKGLEYETEFSGRVVASDGNGGRSEAEFTFISRAIRIVWEVNLGGGDYESVGSVQQSSNGGYLLVGRSSSANGDVGGNNGNSDVWVLELNNGGNLIWEKNLGGSSNDYGESIFERPDGSYTILSQTASNDEDVSDNNGKGDYWVVTLSQDGNTITRERTLGGSDRELPVSMVMTADGGSILAGSSNSSDGDVGGNNGDHDFWIVKLSDSDSLSWETNIGGSSLDNAFSIQQTGDGGYIIAGRSSSDDMDVGGNNGESDFWIVKMDPEGNISWETNLGGAGEDEAVSIRQTINGGYIVAGDSESNDQDVGDNNGMRDFWVVKLDANGNPEWKSNAGGSRFEYAKAVLQSPDGGFLVAGTTLSNDGDVDASKGGSDYWLVKFDENGKLKWEKTFGGSGNEFLRSMCESSDGGFILAGTSASSDGDVGSNKGYNDIWIIKLK